MMDWLGALFLVAGVLVLCRLFGLVSRSRAVLGLAQDSLIVIGDRALDDEAKEGALQRNALRLFAHFVILLLTGGAAFALPLGLVWLAAQAGWLSWDGVLQVTLSWPFLGGTLVATVLALLVYRRSRRAQRARTDARDGGEAGFENRYSAADRWLHYISFASVPVQVGAARLEDVAFRRRLRPVRAERPVFITALPRAGTTLLLNLCSELDEFVTHTYRRMPFVLTPLWWEAFSRRFRVEDAPRERAHGDGLQVSADSPEALEEMLWLAFWEEHYDRDRIHRWDPAEVNDEFVRFFERHMRKLAAIATPAGQGGVRRYLSKNNGNVARVAWLRDRFPDARIVIPFRPPLQHAQSLRRQHLNFRNIHARDPFARHYMAGIGHFDFGANLRPIDFGHWVDRAPASDPGELTYWLRYWTAGYNDLAALAGDRIVFVDFDALSHEPERELGRLADFLEVADRDRLVATRSQIRTPKPHAADMTTVPQAVLDEASAVHARLLGLARRSVSPERIPSPLAGPAVQPAHP